MNHQVFFTLIILTIILISAGCLSNTPVKNQAPVSSQVPAPTAQVPATPDQHTRPESTPDENMVPALAVGTMKPLTHVEQASNLDGFISTSFPEVTGIYNEIKKSRNALEWKQVQDKALELQILIQDLKKENQLNVPNPEKNVFSGLDSRQQIVFLKYLQYLDDMESYATNLKNAVYYQEKGSDPGSAQTARRYQGQADQSEKEAIAEVKTISDYCNDFKYSFFDSKLSDQYRYTG